MRANRAEKLKWIEKSIFFFWKKNALNEMVEAFSSLLEFMWQEHELDSAK